MARTIALIGDYSPGVVAHQAIPVALTLACADLQADVAWKWVATRTIGNAARDLAPYTSVWAVPASPYENMAGVLDAIRWARENKRPFLGTCGGFQHALIEFARNVLAISEADHAETNPSAQQLVVTALTCSLADKSEPLHFTAGSRMREIYGRDSAHEGYRCSYGPNPAFRAAFERAGFRFTAHDELGDPRAAELPVSTHPFFIGALFQPERAALRGVIPPLVRAFVRATQEFSS